MNFVFDIETAPLPEDFLMGFYKPPEPFDESSVKYGNTKDEEKRAAKLQEAIEEYNQKVAQHKQDFLDSATLRGHMCRICAIGYRSPGGEPITHIGGDEKSLLYGFWETANTARKTRGIMVGHNTLGFDLPLLRQRSFVNRVKVPDWVIDKDRFWSPVFRDTMAMWGSGVYPQIKIGLDTLSRVLGGPGKSGKGEHFHTLMESNPEEARRYLECDLAEGLRVAEAFGCFDG